MFENQLKNIGLTKTQADILAFLLENGESKVREITKAVPHPRGVIYKTLEELLELGLAEKQENAKSVAKFKAEHPRNLEKILEKKESDLLQHKKMLEGALPQMISNYNLSLSKPGVKFYEGFDGIRKIVEDTLTSRTEILTFLNKEALNQGKEFQEINAEFKQKRERVGIKKKVLRVGKKPENTFGENTSRYNELTEIKYLEKDLSAFKSSMQIYDNKVSYQLFDEKNAISILIEDKNIYEMNKALFDLVWEEIAK